MNPVSSSTQPASAAIANESSYDEGYFLRMFGPMTIEGAGQPITRFPTKRSALLLARVSISKGKRVARDELAEFLWPDDFLDITRIRLRQELRRLRTAMGPAGAYLRSDRQWIELEPWRITTDVQEFDDAISEAMATTEVEAKAEILGTAVQLLHGPFLAGFQDPWVNATRRKYDESARRAWLALADAHQTLGAFQEALDATINAVRHDPLDTDANANLIRRLVERGQGARARQAFLEFDAMMFRELGRHAPNSVRPPSGAGAEEPVEVAETPEPVHRSAIPRPAPLIGRDDLLESIAGSITRSGARLVLIGMIGVGKTHLIHEAAWRFSQENPDLPIQLGGAAEPIEDGLYVIDGRLTRSELIERVSLASKNGWRVLAESRRRLESDGITEVAVNPLPVPESGDASQAIMTYPSVQLLISQGLAGGNVKAREADLQSLSTLARKLDGVPAALVWYSSRLSTQTPEQIVSALNEDQASFAESSGSGDATVESEIREAFADLSSEMLSALAMLSLLDGASTDLAARFCDPRDGSEIWRQLEKRCLIIVQDHERIRRFRVPNPIAVVVQRVTPKDELAVLEEVTWQKVSEWTFDKSKQLIGALQDHAFEAIRFEMANIRRGLSWATVHDPRLAAFFTVGSWRTVCARGNPTLHADDFLSATTNGADLLDPEWAGEAWTGTAITLAILGRLDEAERAFLRAIEIYSASGRMQGISWANLNYASYVLSHRDKREAARRMLFAAQNAVSQSLRTLALSDYAATLASLGEIDEAIRVAEEAFAAAVQSPDPTAHARGYTDLGELYHVVGRTEAARPLMVEGIRRLREAGIQNMLHDRLVTLAEINLTDPNYPLESIGDTIREATETANLVGSPVMKLNAARLQLEWSSRRGDVPSMLSAIEDVFKNTQASQSEIERVASLRQLSTELERHGKLEYSNAIRIALGEEGLGSYHQNWKAILSTDSHETICVLAVVLAKEAFSG